MDSCDERISSTIVQPSLPRGQQLARTRWGTHASGEAFDRKKADHLTEPACAFIAQQSLCVIAGLDSDDTLGGFLVLDQPGFVQTPDQYTCLLQLDNQWNASRIMQRLRTFSSNVQETRLGLFFICHPTRERLCVQGSAKMLPRAEGSNLILWICLHVNQSFFHCAKYIKTCIAGLTVPGVSSREQMWQLCDWSLGDQRYLPEAIQAFIVQQALCFLCTVDHEGQCAVNHRAGAVGFLITLPPNASSPGGTVLLPDYEGNGAFEAIGNILETGQAALVVPNYVAQVALCISGTARVLDLGDLSDNLVQRCPGAERVVALSVQRVEVQRMCGETTETYP